MIRQSGTLIGHVAAFIVFAAASVAAQAGQSSSTEDRLLDCDSLENQNDRMACFNELVEQLREEPAAAESEEAVAAEEHDAATAAESDIAVAVESAVAEESAGAAPAAAGAVGAVSAAEAIHSAGSTESAVESATASEASSENGIVISDRTPQQESAGAIEEVFRPFTATIVSVREHLDGRFSVELDNGQVWRETQKTRIRTPRAGKTVEVKEGRLGGHQMVVEGIPTAAWVRRTQ